MPKTKFQDFIFTIIMVIAMVYAMVCYNIAFDKGGMSSDIFLLALHELPIMGAVGFVLEFFAVGKLSQKVTFKHFGPKNTNPFVITVMISSVTVAFMCPLMSFIASVLFGFQDAAHIVPNFLQICVRNFPMALFWQLFYAGPLVRFIFRLIFKKQLKEDN